MVRGSKSSEAYVIDAKRTPIGKRNGKLKNKHPVDLLADLMKNVIGKNNIYDSLIDDILVGCVTQNGEQSTNIARNAWLSAGFSETVPATTIDRQCGSSLQAVTFASYGIMTGNYGLVLSGGVESMTRIPMYSNFRNDFSPLTQSLKDRYGINGGWFSQAAGAESIATKWGITREEMDRLGERSHRLAYKARPRTTKEIIPVKTRDDDGKEVTVSEDEGIRETVDLEKMGRLPPAFEGLKMITAGNSSQISDGASLAILASDSSVDEFGLKPRARIISTAAVGVDPITMLTGPIPVTKKVLEKAKMKIDDIDLFEVNEAFASVVLAWQKEFQVPAEKLNIHGGAIAIGHPLGATGTRILATMINALEHENLSRGLIAICEGGGMANGMIVERL
ncbi:acetyl-CoA acetyltransferase [Thermoplasmatales archaeon]|nr:acetyl-CoA acetyltransferase [Thermoplasmatales archaeon]